MDLDALTFSWSIGELEGNVLAGFLEGEIHLGISEQNGGQSYACLAQVSVRDDDAEVLEWITALTGVRALRRVRAYRTSKPQVEWRVKARAECAELARFLERFPFHGRKRLELDSCGRDLERRRPSARAASSPAEDGVGGRPPVFGRQPPRRKHL